MLDARRRLFLKQSLATAATLSLTPGLFAAPYRPQRKVALAVVGCGRQGREILKELAKIEGAVVAALCDPVESRLSSTQKRHEGSKAYASIDALLAGSPEVEAVFVASSTHTHRPIVEACLAAGKAVYCEAPLAHTAEDARAIAAAARASSAVFQSGLLARVNPIYLLANKFYRSGSIQKTVSLRAAWHKKNSWRASSSDASALALLDWKLDPAVSLGLPGEVATHQFDALSWFTGKTPRSVRGTGAVRLHDDGRTVPDTIQLEADFGDGLVMLYEASLANSFEGTHEIVRGTMGAIKLAWTAGWLFKEADAETQGWEVYANRQQFHDEQGITLIADATKLAAQDKLKDGVALPNPPLYYGIETFLKSVTEGAPVACDAGAGLAATLAGIASHEAVATGATVAVSAE
jgi:predicted dehydrogenase